MVLLGVIVEEYLLKSLEQVKEENLFSQKLEFIKTTAQVLGGLFFLITIYVTYQNWQVAQEKQVTDLFTKAIDQLGNDRPEIRLGGIYALKRIAWESEKDYCSIMEILTAYVRQNAKRALEQEIESSEAQTFPRPETDIQAILTVIRDRPEKFRRQEKNRLDLKETNLGGADLLGAHLARSNLQKVNLISAKLEDANLSRANLVAANLKFSKLAGADLAAADLTAAKLMGANLEYANLAEAILRGASSENVRLRGANLSKVDLKGADLSEADLEWAGLWGADLAAANLRGVDLTLAKGLTWEQIKTAKIDEKTKLPDDVEQERQRETGRRRARSEFP